MRLGCEGRLRRPTPSSCRNNSSTRFTASPNQCWHGGWGEVQSPCKVWVDFRATCEPNAPLTFARIRYYSVKVQGVIYLIKQYHRKGP